MSVRVEDMGEHYGLFADLQVLIVCREMSWTVEQYYEQPSDMIEKLLYLLKTEQDEYGRAQNQNSSSWRQRSQTFH